MFRAAKQVNCPACNHPVPRSGRSSRSCEAACAAINQYARNTSIGRLRNFAGQRCSGGNPRKAPRKTGVASSFIDPRPHWHGDCFNIHVQWQVPNSSDAASVLRPSWRPERGVFFCPRTCRHPCRRPWGLRETPPVRQDLGGVSGNVAPSRKARTAATVSP